MQSAKEKVKNVIRTLIYAEIFVPDMEIAMERMKNVTQIILSAPHVLSWIVTLMRTLLRKVVPIVNV